MLTRADINASAGSKRKAYINAVPRSVVPRLPPMPIENKYGDFWEIESVLRKKAGPYGDTYLVAWKGFPFSEASWISGPLPSYFRRHSTYIDLVSSDSDSDSDAVSDAENEADAKAFKPTKTLVDYDNDTESDSEEEGDEMMGDDKDTESDSEEEVDMMESDDEAWPPVVQQHARWGHPPVEQASESDSAAPAAAHDAPAAVQHVTIDLVIPQASGSILNVSFNVSVDGA